MYYSSNRDQPSRNVGSNTESDEFGPPRTPTGYHGARNGYRHAIQPSHNAIGPHRQNNNMDGHEAIEMNAWSPRSRIPPTSSQLDSMEGFFLEVDTLKDDLDAINRNVDEIAQLHNAALTTFKDQQFDAASKDLARLKRETQKLNMDLKNRLKALQMSRFQASSPSVAKIRRFQIEALWKRFFETIERYQDMERMYERKYRQRIERQIKLVKPSASQDEVDRIVQSNDPSQIFAQSLVHTTRSNQGQQVLAEVQNRHDDIKHIEKTIVELHQLLADMSMLVERQGEMLTDIEQNAEYSAGHVQQGNTLVDRAIKQAKATRHKKWICLLLAILICVAIAVLVWWFAFDHPGVGESNQGNTQ